MILCAVCGTVPSSLNLDWNLCRCRRFHVHDVGNFKGSTGTRVVEYAFGADRSGRQSRLRMTEDYKGLWKVLYRPDNQTRWSLWKSPVPELEDVVRSAIADVVHIATVRAVLRS